MMNLVALETYTMMSLLGFGHLLVLVFLLAYRGRRPRSHAFDYFMAARLLQGIGWILISYRGHWPDVLTAHGGNMALMFGLAVETTAFITYRRRSVPVERAFFGIALVSAIVFLFFARTPTLVVGVASAAAFSLSFPAAVILLKRSRESVLLRVVGMLFGIVSISVFIRALSGFQGILDFTVSRSVLQSIFFLSAFSVLLAGSTAMVLLLKEEDERALRESHKKYDILFRSTPSAVFLSERDTGIVLEANPQCRELTGYLPEEIQGRTFTELGLWPPGEREKANAVYRDADRLVDHEMRARRRDEEDRTWLISSGVVQLEGRVLLASSIQDITARKAMETRVQRLLAEKDLLLREVHHRVRNNLNQVSSLLSLQAGRSREPATGAALRDAVNRVHGMLALYDQVYAGNNYTDVPARDFLKLLAERLHSAFPGAEAVRITLDIEDLELAPRTVPPLGQLVNELLTNSMKHAFRDREGGTIRVALNRADGDDDALLLEYEDDGPGLPAVSDQGADGGTSENNGFGTMLIEALAQQLNATWDVTGPPGTRYRFRFRPGNS